MISRRVRQRGAVGAAALIAACAATGTARAQETPGLEETPRLEEALTEEVIVEGAERGAADAPIGGDDPFASLGPPQSADPDAPIAESTPGLRATLRGIDKLTGDLATVEATVGGAVQLWRLDIQVSACFKRAETRAPESSVFMQIFDTKYDPAEQIFSGWMFASSPALSAMDHPRYDVWVISCSTS